MANSRHVIYPSWNDLYKYSDVNSLPWVCKEIHPILKQEIDNLPIKNGYALDVGCGLGQVSRYLAKTGFTTSAIDISFEAISLAKELNDTGKDIKYNVANSVYYESKHEFSLIVDFLHIHDIEKKNIKLYLEGLEKLLARNGYLMIATFIQNNNKNVRRSHFVAQDVFYYSKNEILTYFNKKFRVINSLNITVGRERESYQAYLVMMQEK